MVKELEAKLLEDLADLEHQQWSSFVDYLIAFAPLHGEYNAKVFWEHYHELAGTSYSKLTEEQKEEDRKFARKTLPLIVAFADARVKEVKEEYKRKIALIDLQFESRVKTLASMMAEELTHKAVKEATDKLKHSLKYVPVEFFRCPICHSDSLDLDWQLESVWCNKCKKSFPRKNLVHILSLNKILEFLEEAKP